MMKRAWLVAWMILVFGSGAAFAQSAATPGLALGRSGYFGLGFAGGFLVSPDMGGGMVSLDYYITDEIAVGPSFHLGSGPDDSYWGASGYVKFTAPLASNPDIRPFAFLGIGFVELDFKGRKDDPATTYLFPVGGGLEFEVSDMVIIEGCGIYYLTEDIFTGLMVGVRLIL